MEITKGKVFQNKTKDYLLYTLLDHGDAFEQRFNVLHKLGVGIGDLALVDMGLILKDSIYILVDTKLSSSTFTMVLDWLKNRPYFEFDYAYDDVHTGHLHMIVISIPDTHKETFSSFKKGIYSNMYKGYDLKKLFKSREKPMGVITKKISTTKNFVDLVNRTYNSTVPYQEWEGELDFPLQETEEYFSANLYLNNINTITND